MKKTIILLTLFISVSAHAESWSKFTSILCAPELQVLQVSGVKVPIVLYTRTETGRKEATKIQEKYGLHYPIDEMPVSYSCEVANHIVDLKVNYEPDNAKHCGGDPAALLTLKIDGKPVLTEQNFMVTCFRGPEHVTINSLTVNEWELQLCLQVSDVMYCERHWIDKIPETGLNIRRLFLEKRNRSLK